MSMRMVLLTTAPPAAGVALGGLLGGRLAGLRILATRALWLVWVAAAVQLIHNTVAGKLPLLAVVFLAVLAWLAVGIAGWPQPLRAAAAVIMIGAALNGLAIAGNGRMPYEPAAARAAGLTAGVVTAKNEPAHEHTRLAVLGDTIPVPPLRAVISPGDILIGAGACALVALAMRRRRRDGPVSESGDAEEVNHDPHLDLAASRFGDPHRGGPGDTAHHDRRTDDRGKLTSGGHP
ncbi:DUF5317 family protein [Actinoplanes sp. NPDC048967]|uniref:DUF5317 family protein n=1 Tax=Actinoplanes sp. NPDC048967 TaxID=3155269 RepID=UPI0033CB34C2